MNERKGFSVPVVGGSSLLVIFAVLCLTVFALLSVATVRANGRLSDEAAAAIYEYYEADGAAEEILARLRAGERPECVKEQDGVFLFTCPVSDTQTLVVEATVEEHNYKILRWQTVSTTQWEADDDLPVWGGDITGEEREWPR